MTHCIRSPIMAEKNMRERERERERERGTGTSPNKLIQPN